jgi:hypothetical protein
MVGLTSTWRLPIYTTNFNAWMLKNKFKVGLTRFDFVVVHSILWKNIYYGSLSLFWKINMSITSVKWE